MVCLYINVYLNHQYRVIETKMELFIFQLLFLIFFNEDIKFEKKKERQKKI